MQALNIFYVLIAIAMVALILVQKGAGATAGAAFGSGASGTVFGSRGAGNFLTRTTWVLATLFCSISLLMAVLVSRMSASPETDLGVLSAAPAATEEVENGVSDSGLVIPEEGSDFDLPALDVGADGQAEGVGSEAAGAVLESADDFPSIEDTGAATTELNQGDPASGAESDDS